MTVAAWDRLRQRVVKLSIDVVNVNLKSTGGVPPKGFARIRPAGRLAGANAGCCVGPKKFVSSIHRLIVTLARHARAWILEKRLTSIACNAV